MDEKLAIVKCQYDLIYTVDPIVFLMTPVEHLQQVEEAFKLQNNEEMTIKLTKCSTFCKTNNYVVLIIAPVILKVATQPTEAIKAQHYPTTVSVLCSHLRMCYIYQRFVPKFAKLDSPLSKKLKKGAPSQSNFDGEKMKAVQVVKDKLITPPISTLSISNDQ